MIELRYHYVPGTVLRDLHVSILLTSTKAQEVGPIIIPTWYLRELRHRDAK